MDWVLIILCLAGLVALAVLKTLRRKGSVVSRVKVSRDKTLKRRRNKKKKLRRKPSAFLLDRTSERRTQESIATGVTPDDTESFDEVVFSESPEPEPHLVNPPGNTQNVQTRVSGVIEEIFGAEKEEGGEEEEEEEEEVFIPSVQVINTLGYGEEQEEEEEEEVFIPSVQVINTLGYEALPEEDAAPQPPMVNTEGYENVEGSSSRYSGPQGSYYLDAYRGGDGYVFPSSGPAEGITCLFEEHSATLQRKLLCSSAEAPMRRGQPVGWNAMFQELLELPEHEEQQRLDKYNSLSALAEDFVCVAQQSGRTIISEAFLPAHSRTIQPMELGGQAGGEKYVHNGMLFKFATDWKNLYGGDCHAMKAAGHELKGLMRYYLCEGLHVPLMALVDYKGFRLVAQSILPISSRTLVYGSADSGRTVVTSNPHFNDKMKKAGDRLHLKGHLTKSGAVIYGPTDIEGHIGTDGRHYVLDLARVFPPTCTDESVKRTFLYQLMRPEFVARSRVHLNSDAWSGFCSFSEKHPDNVEVKQQTHRLLNVVLPKFCEWLEAEGPPASLTEHLHRRGINCRYYGLVRQRLKDPALRRMVASEVMARAAKNLLHSNFRGIARSIVIPGDSVYKREVARMITCLTSADAAMWSGLRTRALTSFPGCIGAEEQVPDIVDMPVMLRRLLQLTGVLLGKRAWEELKQNWQGFVVVVSDVVSVGGKVKHMNVVAYSDAMSLYLQSKNSSSVSNAARLFTACEARFDRAIEAVPDSGATLRQYAEVLVEHGCSRAPLGDSLYFFRKALDKRREARDLQGICSLGSTVLQHVGSHWSNQKELLLLAEECFHIVLSGKHPSDVARIGLSNALCSRALLSGDKRLMASAGVQLRKAAKEKAGAVPKFAQYLSDAASTGFAEVSRDYMAESRVDTRTLMSCPSDQQWEKILRSAKPRQLVISREPVLRVVCRLPFWKGLTHLHLAGPLDGLTDHSLAEMLSCGIHLLSLEFSRVSCVGNSTISAIAEHHSALRTLGLRHCAGLALLNTPPLESLAARCTSVETLSLRGSQMPQRRFRFLVESLKSVTRLDLRDTEASHLPAHPQLSRLTALHVDFAVYSVCESLTELTTHGCSEHLCTMLAKLCPGQLTVLRLPDAQLSDSAVLLVAQASPRLRRLSLSGCLEITDACLAGVSTCRQLARLDVSRCRFITGAGVETVASGCHMLTHLDVSGCLLVGDISKVFLGGQVPLLSVAKFNGCQYLTGSSVTSMIRSCPALTCIQLSGCKYVKDRALSMMLRLQLLSQVSLSGVKASDAAVKSLAKAKPSLQIT